MYALARKYHDRKPGTPGGIDWTHPLARGLTDIYLLQEGGGAPRNLAAPGRDLTLINNPLWGISRIGRALNFNGSTQYARYDGATAIEGQRFVTMACVAAWTSTATDRRFMAFGDSGGSTPYWGFGPSTTSGKVRCFLRTAVAGFVSLDGGASLNNGLPHACIVTTDSDYANAPANANKLYIDGKLAAQANSNSAWTAANMQFDKFSLGAGYRSTGAGEYFNGAVIMAAVWTRKFDPSELEWWSREPFVFLKPARRRIWVPVSTSVFSVTKSCTLESAAGIAKTAVAPREGAASMIKAASAPVESTATIAFTPAFLLQLAAAIEKLSPMAFESVTAISSHYAIAVEAAADLRQAAALWVDAGLTIEAERIANIAWTLTIARAAGTPVEFSANVAAAQGLPVEWAGEAIFEITAALPIEHGAEVKAARSLPAEGLHTVILAEPLPLDLLADAFASREIVFEALKKVNAHGDLPADWSALMIVSETVPVEWEGQAIFLEGKARLLKADKRGRVFASSGRARLFPNRRKDKLN